MQRTGRCPASPSHSKRAPRDSKIRMPSPIGRSRKRADPSIVTGSSQRVAAANMKRAGVPPSPKSTVPPRGNRPPTPWTSQPCSSSTQRTPNVCSATTNRSQSSLRKAPVTTDVPSDKAAKRRARLVPLLEPGTVIRAWNGPGVSGVMDSGSGWIRGCPDEPARVRWLRTRL